MTFRSRGALLVGASLSLAGLSFAIMDHASDGAVEKIHLATQRDLISYELSVLLGRLSRGAKEASDIRGNGEDWNQLVGERQEAEGSLRAIRQVVERESSSVLGGADLTILDRIASNNKRIWALLEATARGDTPREVQSPHDLQVELERLLDVEMATDVDSLRTSLCVATIEDERHLEALTTGSRAALIGLSSGSFLLLGAFVLSQVRSLRARLRTLATAAARVRSGELGVEVEVRGNDELDEVGRAFNKMSRRLHTEATKATYEAERRTLAERELRLTEHSLERISDAIYWLNADGGIERVNQAAVDALGYSKEEFRSMGVSDIDPAVTPETWPRYWASVRDEQNIAFEVTHVTKDGRGIPFELTAGYISFEGEEYGCAIARNITERRAMELRQEAQKEELEHRNKELDTFAYVASHDLKAPLRAIRNLAKWIQDAAYEQLPEDSRRHFDTLMQRVQRMNRLLDDLLAYSRAGRVEGNPESIVTTELVKEVMDLVDPPPTFRVRVAEGLPELRSPRAPLQQVFLNLIANAVKHHDSSSGSIEVTSEDEGELVAFRVTDDGPGIPAEFHERIFEMFQTLKPRDEVEGSGMGLAVIKKVIESRGGSIRVESTGQRGTTFRFTWPKDPAGHHQKAEVAT